MDDLDADLRRSSRRSPLISTITESNLISTQVTRCLLFPIGTSAVSPGAKVLPLIMARGFSAEGMTPTSTRLTGCRLVLGPGTTGAFMYGRLELGKKGSLPSLGALGILNTD